MSRAHELAERDPAEHCPATGKRKYASIADVKRAMRGLRASLRHYRCPFCRGLHLSKKDEAGKQ